MSFTYVKLFIYISAGFIGLMNFAFLFFLSKNTDSVNMKLYRATRNFTLSVLLLIVLYFFFLFSRHLFGGLSNSAPLRVLDILSFVSLKYFWLMIIFDISTVKNVGLKRFINITFFVFTVLCIINFGFIMDFQYYIANLPLRYYVITVNVLLSVVPFVINFYLILKYYSKMINQLDKVFIIVTSILIHLNAFWNSTMAIGLYSGKIYLSTWITPIIDPTSLILLLINLNLFIFIFRKDFSPLFKLKIESLAQLSNSEISDQGIIDIMAFKHSLTVREREVAILVYQGYTNPDIAERLYISRNTVRNHIHNIFYKLDISSRIELVHLVDSQK